MKRAITVGHYAWAIALCCFLIVFCNMGLASTSFNVYQPYLVALPGIGDTAGSIVIGVRTLVAFLSMFLVMRYYRLVGYRRGAALCCASTALSFVLFAHAASLPALCLAAAFAGFSYGVGGMVCVTYLVNRWFRSDVGSVVGLAAVGSGIASMLIPLLAEWVIRTFSLSTAFYLEALIAALIALCVWLVLRADPAELGLEPFERASADGGGKPGRTSGASKVLAGCVSLSAGEQKAMLSACILLGAASVSAMAFLSVLLVSEGQSHQYAATMLAVAGLVLTIGKAVLGRVFDLAGILWGSLIGFGALIIGFTMLCIFATGDTTILAIGVISTAFGIALASTGISLWSMHFSLPEHRAATVRRFQTGYVFGSFAFSFAPGLLKDLLGSYIVSYWIMAAMMVIALVLVVTVYFRTLDSNTHATDER